MRKQIFLLVAFSCIIACSVSTAAKSETFRTEMHEFINSRGEKVKYPLAITDPDNGTEKGPQDQVHIGQILQTEDGKEKVIAIDGHGSYVTEIVDD